MEGLNEIVLNQATMVAAVQHYFKTVLFRDGHVPNVSTVSAESKSSYSTGLTFKIVTDGTVNKEDTQG